MPLIEDHPSWVQAHLAGMTPVVIAATDLQPDGRFGTEWLLITDAELQVLPGEGVAPRLRLPLAQVQAVEEEALVGGSALLVRLVQGRQELLRATTARRALLGRVSGYLTAVIAARKTPSATPPTIDPDPDAVLTCPRCGTVLPVGTQTCLACVRKTAVLRRMLAYLRPHLGLTLLALACMLLGIAASLVPPYLTRPFLDRVLAPAPGAGAPARAHALALIVLGMLGAGILSQAIAIVRARTLIILGKRVCQRLRLDVYAHLQRMSLRYFDRRKGGQLVARVTQDTDALESVLVDGTQYFLVNVLTLIGIGLVLLTMNWRLTLLVLLPVPVVLVVSRLFWPRMVALWQRFYHLRGGMVAGVAEVISGMRVVKAFAKEPAEFERFARLSGAALRADQEAELMWATFFPILTYITASGALLVNYVGGLQVIRGAVTPGTLIAFTMYLGMFYGPLQWLSRIADYLARSLASSARIFEVLDTVPEVRDAQASVALPRMRGEIAFEQVVFGYDRHRPALKGISCTIAAGEMVGLVGHSGAGKSTLINLLCRFYDVDDGRILIDGIDLRRIATADLRSQIGVVLQDTFLFNGTIRDNIAYARPDASPAQVIAAATAANAHDFICGKPDGYDTMLGERGVTLSGGERQRLAIARAILHDPRVLILDEATASVDTDTEHQIQQAIQRLVQGRTTIAIAHRLSTLRHAHRLIVLKGGTIAEMGTHAELLAREGGEFRRLVTMQQAQAQIVEVA